MSDKRLTAPDLILLVGTRGALGIGIGLLISEKLSSDSRKGAGVALLAMGALSTIPIAMKMFDGCCNLSGQKVEDTAN